MTAVASLPTVLVVSEDDDISAPLETVLKRAGYRVEIASGREGAQFLADALSEGGRPPDILILDHDLRPDDYRSAMDALATRGGEEQRLEGHVGADVEVCPRLCRTAGTRTRSPCCRGHRTRGRSCRPSCIFAAWSSTAATAN